MKLDLGGNWRLREEGSDEFIQGALPGCNYLDLMKNGRCKDPFWGTNEKNAMKLGERDYEYDRYFDLEPSILSEECVELVVSGLDTLAVIWINGSKIAETDNAHRCYRFETKPYLKEKNNHIRILFKAPLPFLREKQKQTPLPGLSMGVKGVPHIRKPQCHFGWDWGPILAASGITGSILLEAYSTARISEARFHQRHLKSRVELEAKVSVEWSDKNSSYPLSVVCLIKSPEGACYEGRSRIEEDSACIKINIDDPRLWWSNGLGEQPLYNVELQLLKDEKYIDTLERKIGLRTIELDTSEDRWGRNFQFRVNGVPVFAKGADWIPSDSFVTRTTLEVLEFYIKSAREANMNMLRVWGGGYYESDLFYELCDKYGILVWQDFGFACMPYMFYDEAFLENVKQEVSDNVKRLRHHASLALWCGNNEIDIISPLWKSNKRLYNSGREFFHKQLPEWVAKLDDATPYWPGSPSSGIMQNKPNDLSRGDTHLWQIWHGMLPIEGFRKFKTRFCSEFGMESLPSIKTIRSFAEERDMNLFSPVMLAHQKSGGGNHKIMFYLLSRFRNPASFEDFVYLSQLTQAETVRFATEEWRRNTGRCNGSLYWQYNDCWPVASWAGIDYGRQYKAVQYRARHFNQMLCVSAAISSNEVEIYVVNDYKDDRSCTVLWELQDFRGERLASGNIEVKALCNKAAIAAKIDLPRVLEGRKKTGVALVVELKDKDTLLSKQNYLLVADKWAALEKPAIEKSLVIKEAKAELTLTSDTYARFVYIDIDGVTTPLSDNFFDIEGGKSYSITFDTPATINPDKLMEAVHIKSLADVPPKGSIHSDRLLRFRMRMTKQNFFSWLIFKFF